MTKTLSSWAEIVDAAEGNVSFAAVRSAMSDSIASRSMLTSAT
ncbi:hypothetical protein [Serinicoccus profundi]|nr:hypothetical protein [Serinicoccus profundi]